MPSYVPPGINEAFIIYVSVTSQADTNIFQVNPTIAAGDFQVSTDGGALGNLATLPVVTPAASKVIEINLSAAEMNGDNVVVVGSDAVGAEWQDVLIILQTSTKQIDDLATQAEILSDATPFAGANIATILARIGAFTGAGVNTILGFLQAMAQKAATLPSDIGGTFTPTTDSLEAIRDALRRSPVVASIEDNELTILRGDSYDSDDDDPIEDLGDISTRTALWFTAKKSLAQEDADAIIQITELGGLLILNGAAYGTAAHGVITVTDAVAGDITITIDEAATAELDPAGLEYDIQWLSAAGDVQTVQSGKLTITADVTRAII